MLSEVKSSKNWIPETNNDKNQGTHWYWTQTIKCILTTQSSGTVEELSMTGKKKHAARTVQAAATWSNLLIFVTKTFWNEYDHKQNTNVKFVEQNKSISNQSTYGYPHGARTHVSEPQSPLQKPHLSVLLVISMDQQLWGQQEKLNI